MSHGLGPICKSASNGSRLRERKIDVFASWLLLIDPDLLDLDHELAFTIHDHFERENSFVWRQGNVVGFLASGPPFSAPANSQAKMLCQRRQKTLTNQR